LNTLISRERHERVGSDVCANAWLIQLGVPARLIDVALVPWAWL
jgi:hypothetical protein